MQYQIIGDLAGKDFADALDAPQHQVVEQGVLHIAQLVQFVVLVGGRCALATAATFSRPALQHPDAHDQTVGIVVRVDTLHLARVRHH